jgi:AcrR family transcriptional regulator
MGEAATGERRYRQRTTSERRAERRAKLLEAALEAFATDGYTATSVEQLCTRAGVSTRNFYEEFTNREAVLIELHDALNARAFEAVVAATAAVVPLDATDPAVLDARIEAGVRAYLETMTSDHRWSRIALVESVGVSPTVDAARRVAIDRFAGFLEDEARRLAALGLAEDRPYDLTVVGIVGAFNELVGTWPTRGGEPGFGERLAAEATRFIVTALRPG